MDMRTLNTVENPKFGFLNVHSQDGEAQGDAVGSGFGGSIQSSKCQVGSAI